MLHRGHALTVARELSTGSINLIVAGPPCYGLRDYGVEGKYLLDPFSGSGTTGLAAQRTGHRYISIALTAVCEDVAGWRRLRSSDNRSVVSASCRCRDVAVTRDAMESHDYLDGGGLPVYDASPHAGGGEAAESTTG
jgi:DNA methylase